VINQALDDGIKRYKHLTRGLNDHVLVTIHVIQVNITKLYFTES